MVAHLVRLKLALLRNGLRRSPWQLVGMAIGALYGLGILATVVVGLFVLSFADPSIARTVHVLAGSLLVAGWAVIPIVAAGVDMTLDPARFVTFAVPMPRLMAGLALSGLLGIPGGITTLAVLAAGLSWWRHPAALAVSVGTSVLGVFTCVLVSRAVTAASSNLAASRRFKDLSTVIVMVPIVLLGPIIATVSRGVRDFRDILPAAAETLSWTPLGAVWAVPAEVAQVSYGTAALKFAVAAASAALLAWLWKLGLARALVTPVHTGSRSNRGGKQGLFRIFPSTPAGAVAARCLTYWFRDPRYSSSLVVSALLPLIFVFVSRESGATGLVTFGGAIVAFLVSWSISADVSYDSTAFCLHVATGVSGTADRAGRALACGMLATPLVLAVDFLTAVFTHREALLPATVGLSIGVLLTGLGLSSVVSARYTYSVPAPGESPFKARPGNGFAVFGVQLAGWSVLLVLVSPEAALAIAAALTGNALAGWLAVVTGLVFGSAMLLLGIRVGGKWYDRRAPELLLAVSKER